MCALLHVKSGVHPKNEGGGRPLDRSPHPKKQTKTGFVDMISHIFRDVSFSWNDPPNSTNDKYIRILKYENLQSFTKQTQPNAILTNF
jgi:hypothetical protein